MSDVSRPRTKMVEGVIVHDDGRQELRTFKTFSPPRRPELNTEDAAKVFVKFGLSPQDLADAAEEEKAAIQRARDAANEVDMKMLRQLAADLTEGRISQRQLAEVYHAYRALARVGWASRWDSIIPLQSSMILNETFYDADPDGCWRGPWPLEWGNSIPLAGTPVVYWLYDGAGDVCYIGSSENLRERLKWHASDGKVFERWEAKPYSTRDDAYEAEVHLLQTGPLPYLNRKASR